MSGEFVNDTSATAPGFFGKIPLKGDFLTRRLPDEFVAPWDDWLQRSIADSKERMGEDWLPAYLNGPIWRFVLPAGVCGDAMWAGVLMPSVDKVGRYFPLTLAARLERPDTPFHVAAQAVYWFESAEDAMLDVLEAGENGLQQFDEALQRLAQPSVSPLPPGSGSSIVHGGGFWRIGIESTGGMTDECSRIVDNMLKQTAGDYSLWWTDGADRVKPMALVFDGLPEAGLFVEFLGGAKSLEPTLETDDVVEVDPEPVEIIDAAPDLEAEVASGTDDLPTLEPDEISSEPPTIIDAESGLELESVESIDVSPEPQSELDALSEWQPEPMEIADATLDLNPDTEPQTDMKKPDKQPKPEAENSAED